MDAHLLLIIKLIDNVPERKDIISCLLTNPGFDPKKTNSDGYTLFDWAQKEEDEILLSCFKESKHMLGLVDERQDTEQETSIPSNANTISSTSMICFSAPTFSNQKKRKLSDTHHP